jgi:hypothetical protein
MSGFTHGITPVRGKWSNFLPDKEFRYLRHVCYLRSPLHEGARSAGRSFLPPSPCRHGGRTISSSVHTDARRGVSEGSADSSSTRPSLLIVPTRRIVTAHVDIHGLRHRRWLVPRDTREFPAYSRVLQRPLFVDRYSYGRRLPALRFRASLPEGS